MMNEYEKVELLDHVTACQSAYLLEGTNSRLCVPGELQENRTALVQYVQELIEKEGDNSLALQASLCKDLAQALKVLVQNGGIGPEQMFRDAREVLQRAGEL
jgi:hypothetical protein